MDATTVQGIEAILFLADEPVDLSELSAALDLDPDEVETAVRMLAERYDADGRGLAIRQVAGGWRMYTAPSAHPLVERYVLAGRSGRLTQAALETLAVIAYKQPISRQEIGEIRGVNADGAVRSLAARGYVAEVGRDDGPGQAILYGTTTTFLEKLGLDALDDLPALTDFMPEAPAPDEPGLERLREARKRLASGGDLPSTGAARWRPDDDPATNTGADADHDPGEEDADAGLSPLAPRADRRDQDAEMDELTAKLEAAARSAMDQLREAVAATDRDDDPEEGPDDRPGGVSDGGPEATAG